ncbi:MAG TPA: CAP domain-containing protein [Solirubrobacteraceae bacterium]|nr:CAP domain-containing protein [Solirubrobacteraceae bacterium]
MGGTAILGGAAACLCLGTVGLLATPEVTSVATAGTLGHGARPIHRHLPHRARTGSTAAPVPCPHADVPATSASASEMAAAVDCLVNQQRLRFGLPPMKVSRNLNRSAQKWSDQMVATGNFTHGSDAAFRKRLLAAGFNWAQAGENIATGYLTPRDAVAGWMASPDHCKNILDPDYREMGTGENRAPVGASASGPATWTQDMGLLMSQSPASGDHGPENGCPYTIASSPGG